MKAAYDAKLVHNDEPELKVIFNDNNATPEWKDIDSKGLFDELKNTLVPKMAAAKKIDKETDAKYSDLKTNLTVLVEYAGSSATGEKKEA